MTIRLFTLSVFSALFFFISSGCHRGQQNVEAVQYKPKVKTFVVQLQEITPTIESYGNLSYTRKADITVSVEGTYENLYFEEGDQVTANAIVTRLSNVQMDIQVAQAHSSLNSAHAGLELAQASYEEGRRQVEARLLGIEKSEIELKQKRREVNALRQAYEDQKTLFNVGGVTQSTLLTSELSYLSAKSEIASMEKDLEIRRIGLRNQDIRAAGLTIPQSKEERTTVLTDINTLTLRAELDVARARVETAETQLESALALERELTIRSPITGIIGARGPEVGEKASQGDSIYTVFQEEGVHVVFPIQEADAVSVKKEMSVDVQIDAFPGQAFTAFVDRISPVVDPQSGNVTVRALINENEVQLRPGMFARVKVAIQKPRRSILLPSSAIFEKQDDDALVFTVRNGKAFATSVQLGRQFGEQFEVLNNLDEGEVVIDEPSPILKDGEEIDDDS